MTSNRIASSIDSKLVLVLNEMVLVLDEMVLVLNEMVLVLNEMVLVLDFDSADRVRVRVPPTAEYEYDQAAYFVRN